MAEPVMVLWTMQSPDALVVCMFCVVGCSFHQTGFKGMKTKPSGRKKT
ncbi:MAG: hypothetical protein JJE25_07075 [Bacteroidia bacterium]|nr:hypothetical protein [Bacteroidia bacterium]